MENFESEQSAFGSQRIRAAANCQLPGFPKGNASQEVLLLRGWLNSWPMRSDVSQTVSVSSFLLSSWLP
jgi:hypothetical protein